MRVFWMLCRKAGFLMPAFGRVTMVVLCGLGASMSLHAASLDPAILPSIQAATFEVVAAKPVDDPLTYEKPLPLDLLPFQQRNDKYYSIGTAFALGKNRYVTAAHVLQVGIDSLWGEPELRDAAGHVYAIDKIEKYSLQQDFVVFSLVKPPAVKPLKVNQKPALNDTVYAVGNALGTGVIIRDGLYTSDTPEDQDGRWKWMRFSAAASPGNSGGPLLDSKGRLIGVVLMKSANENLNYALPISAVINAPDHLAVIDKRIPYQFDVFDTIVSNAFTTRFALPLSFADFSAAFQQRFNTYVDSQLKVLLAKEPARLFPNGEGSHKLLYGDVSMQDFPALITRDSDGSWSLARKTGDKVTLPANGYVTPGYVGRNLLFHIRKPDDVSAAKLYSDPVRMMDMIAKVGFLRRQVGPESIKITSLGKPTTDTLYTDAWKRHWQVRVWPLPSQNGLVISMALPVPDGYVVMMRSAQASQQHDTLINLQALADFFYVTYDGTLAQWQAFLKNSSLLPEAFKTINLDIDYGHRFGYRSKRVKFTMTSAMQQITPESMLTLGFSFFPDNHKVVWDVSDVWLAASAHDTYWTNVGRAIAPAPDLNDDYKSSWNKMLYRKRPYNEAIRNEDDLTKISAVAGPPAADKPQVLYVAYHYAEGTHDQAAMKAKLDTLMKTLQVEEH